MSPVLPYLLAPAAVRDLQEIADYTWKHWGSAQRDHHLRDLHDHLVDLARSPARATPRDDLRPGYRLSRVGSHVVYFRMLKEQIEIIRILHIRMDPTRHLPDA